MLKHWALLGFVARRFLLSKSSDGFLSLITWVSVVGVALGVVALTTVTSVINGFEGELIRVTTGANGHLLLYTRARPVARPEKVEAKIRKVLPEARAITRSYLTELMISGPHGVAGSVLEGIVTETLPSVLAVQDNIRSGRLPKGGDEVALGSALAERIGAREGMVVRLVVPKEDGEARVFDAQVVGIVRMGMYQYDSKYIYAPMTMVQDMMGTPGQVTAFKIRLSSVLDASRAADALNENFGYPFRAKDWSEINHNLFVAIKLEKAVISIMLTAIVVVAAFNVVSTLMMMIHEKTRAICTLKAMGFKRGEAFRLFCFIGLGIGAAGVLLGIGLGLVCNWVVAHFPIVDLPAEIYYIDFLPVVENWLEIGLIAALTLLICLAATLGPAYRVGRMSPLEGLRLES